jgi:four helix bundle protein
MRSADYEIMKYENLKLRTKQFALSVIELVEEVPSRRVTDVLTRQLIRSATSVGANYRSACRAKSPADFISKMGTVEEEADESVYWLEMLRDANFVDTERVANLVKEAEELVAIVVASIRTAKRNTR